MVWVTPAKFFNVQVAVTTGEGADDWGTSYTGDIRCLVTSSLGTLDDPHY